MSDMSKIDHWVEETGMKTPDYGLSGHFDGTISEWGRRSSSTIILHSRFLQPALFLLADMADKECGELDTVLDLRGDLKRPYQAAGFDLSHAFQFQSITRAEGGAQALLDRLDVVLEAGAVGTHMIVNGLETIAPFPLARLQKDLWARTSAYTEQGGTFIGLARSPQANRQRDIEAASLISDHVLGAENAFPTPGKYKGIAMRTLSGGSAANNRIYLTCGKTAVDQMKFLLNYTAWQSSC